MALDVATLAIKVDTTDLKKGEASMNKLAATGKRVEMQTQKVGKSFGGSSNNLRMFSQQMSQVAQQGAVTGNYMQALTLQAADIGLAFGTVGIAVGALTPILYGLASGFLGAGEEAKTLEENLDDLNAAMKAFSAASDQAGGSITDLLKDYGNLTGKALELLYVQRDLAQLDALDALERTAESAAEAFGRLEGNYISFSDALLLGAGFSTASVDISAFNNTVGEIAEKFEISEGAAKNFAQSLLDVSNAQGPAEQAQALENVRNVLLGIAGGLENMDEGTRAFYTSLVEAERAALRLSAIDIATPIGAGADEAERLAIALQAAAEAEVGLDAFGGYGAFKYGVESTFTTDKPRKARGGKSQAEREAEAIQKVVDRLQDEIAMVGMSEQARRTYQAVQRAGVDLYSEEGQNIADLVEQLYNLEQRYEGLESFADMGSSAFADAFVSWTSGAESFADAFSNMASSILADLARMIAQQAIYNALAMAFGIPTKSNPAVSVLGGLIGFDGGGYTGDGSRSGGLDGKGGFLAMLHPQETVTDHTKGGVVPSQGKQNVEVNAIIVQDERQVGNYLRSPDGERDIQNVLIKLGVA